MRILDATCSTRSMWFDKQFPDCTYIDIREEVEPDKVMDCRHTDFPAGEFDLILFDPPHLNMGKTSIMAQHYGHFTTAEILNLIAEAFIEFARILKPDRLVLLKWNNHDIKLERILKLIPSNFKPLFGQSVAYRTKHSSQTYWVSILKLKESK